MRLDPHAIYLGRASIRPIEAPNDDRLQERRFKIPQVHPVTSGGRGFNRLPMGDDAAGLAAKIPQRSIAPDVAFRILGMTLDRDRAKFVVGPYPACAPTQRTVATRRRFGRRRQREAHQAAVAGTVQRGWMLFLAHLSMPLVVVLPNA